MIITSTGIGRKSEGFTWFAPVYTKGKKHGTITGETLDEVLEKQLIAMG